MELSGQPGGLRAWGWLAVPACLSLLLTSFKFLFIWFIQGLNFKNTRGLFFFLIEGLFT